MPSDTAVQCVAGGGGRTRDGLHITGGEQVQHSSGHGHGGGENSSRLLFRYVPGDLYRMDSVPMSATAATSAHRLLATSSSSAESDGHDAESGGKPWADDHGGATAHATNPLLRNRRLSIDTTDAALVL